MAGQRTHPPMDAPCEILVTGHNGFVGRHVRRLWGDVVSLDEVDLTEHRQVTDKVQELALDHPFGAVLHLAAASSPRASLADPVTAFQVNLMGTVHLLDALTRVGWKGRFLFASSCAIYGSMVGRLSEDTPPRPTTPYAVSKLAAEHAVLEWGVRTGNEAIVARPFNHSGPGQKPHYFLASMAKQMASLPPEGGTIEVGNLGVRRDFMHVEDVIGAYRLLLSRGKPQEIYHIATGRSRPLSDYLELLRRHCPHPVEWVVSPERYRDETTQPVEISTERLRLHTGWSPQRTTDELCRDLIEYWTEKQKKGD